MKKIFTLLFASCFLTAAFAQTGSRDTRDTRTNQQYDQRVDQKNGQWDNTKGYSNDKDITRNNDRFGNDDRFNNSNSIEMQIAHINRKYDFQVKQVQNSFFMRRYEKMRTIRSLEAQRQQEIKMLYASSSNRQHARGFDSNRRY